MPTPVADPRASPPALPLLLVLHLLLRLFASQPLGLTRSQARLASLVAAGPRGQLRRAAPALFHAGAREGQGVDVAAERETCSGGGGGTRQDGGSGAGEPDWRRHLSSRRNERGCSGGGGGEEGGRRRMVEQPIQEPQAGSRGSPASQADAGHMEQRRGACRVNAREWLHSRSFSSCPPLHAPADNIWAANRTRTASSNTAGCTSTSPRAKQRRAAGCGWCAERERWCAEASFFHRESIGAEESHGRSGRREGEHRGIAIFKHEPEGESE